MEKNQLLPISASEFSKKIKTDGKAEQVDFVSFFQPQIENAVDFAIGPFYWFIPDNSIPVTLAVSASYGSLSPYSTSEFIAKSSSPEFFSEHIHTDDRKYVLSAIDIAMKTSSEYKARNEPIPKFNIYCRMINANWEYAWRLLQFPGIYFNRLHQAESVFVMVTDLSHLPYLNQPMMTMIDNHNKENQYFAINVETQFLNPIRLPKITSREQDLIRLIVKGKTNPDIAKELNISINTVQNHKRNLREKTATHTSAELVAFIMKYNLV